MKPKVRKITVPKIPAILSKAGFSLNANGAAEKTVNIPTGELRMQVTAATMGNIKTLDHVITAVAVLGFKGGQNSRDQEVASAKAESERRKLEAQGLQNRVGAVARVLGISDY